MAAGVAVRGIAHLTPKSQNQKSPALRGFRMNLGGKPGIRALLGHPIASLGQEVPMLDLLMLASAFGNREENILHRRSTIRVP